MDTGTISRVMAAYLAGIIDGEGCLRIDVGTPKNAVGNRTFRAACKITIVNTNPDLIRRVSEIYKELGIRFNFLYEKGQGTWKDRLRIVASNDKAVRTVLEFILPYLTAKREEAETLLGFVQWRIEKNAEDGRDHRWTEEKKTRAEQTHARLSELKSRRPSFQRLPRSSSQVLAAS